MMGTRLFPIGRYAIDWLLSGKREGREGVMPVPADHVGEARVSLLSWEKVGPLSVRLGGATAEERVEGVFRVVVWMGNIYRIFLFAEGTSVLAAGAEVPWGVGTMDAGCSKCCVVKLEALDASAVGCCVDGVVAFVLVLVEGVVSVRDICEKNSSA